ncbi:hypothetical protein A0H81_03446 [Grifola frondosa]|uniref:Acyl-CoA thioesterase-like N-terminal HotDog domain-containing protein n=1 Tax=Grifola frondosa TaxID=5627 RepID=A0A1C7MIZ3_GRIFR|nr:hypothetical protein A0H81_03446 [Grifola frondosa]
MAPLSKALAVVADPSCSTSGKDGVSVYSAAIDPEWVILQAPQGGYSVGIILEAAIQHQSGSKHPDPIHLTVHFLRIPRLATLHVHVRVLKIGRDFTNLLADLVQNDTVMITTHMMFGVLVPPPSTPHVLTLAPPHPKARRTPMQTHPSKCTWVPDTRFWGTSKHIRDAHDPVYVARSKSDAEGMQWGTYFMLPTERGPLRPSMIPCLADSAMGLVESMGVSVEEVRKWWYATTTLTMEFKFPIPPASSADHSPRTVALFSTGAFANDPQARHDTRVEVWTAPSDIGEGEERAGWRETQRCLAVMNTVMVVVPAAVNINAGAKGGKL